MKILLFTQHFWPENFRINQVATSLSLRNHEIFVITAKPNYPKGKIFSSYNLLSFDLEKFNDINILRVPIVPRGKNIILLILNYISYIFNATIFAPLLLKNKKFDIVLVYATSPIFQAIPAIIFCKLKKIPLAIWVQDLWPESVEATGFIKNKFFLNILRFFVKVIYVNADSILIQSQAFKKSISKFTSKKNIYYLPNSYEGFGRKFTIPGVNLKNIVLSNLRNKFIITFTGNIGKAQALNILIDAANHLKKIKKLHFLIVGDGRCLNEIKVYVKKLNLSNITFLGELPHNYMPFIMKNSSALYLSLTNSYIFSLTVPSKLQAYMSSSKPIIASISGEAANIIRNSNCGYACKPENSKMLSRIIKKIYFDSEYKRLQMGLNAKKYFDLHFEHHTLINKLIKFLEITKELHGT